MSIRRREFLRSAAIAGALGVPIARASAEDEADGPEWPGSPFLGGNYAPVFEEVEADDLRVVGRIPDGLEGMFVRNGPNPQFPPIGDYHWFDGDGMLHGVRIRGGRASYRNRWIRTRGFVEERQAGRALWGGLGSPPDPTMPLQGRPLFKNTANTALIWHDGKLMALWEGGEPHVVSVPDLGTVGPFDFDGALRHAFTAHPKVDPTTGELFCFGYQPVPPYLRYSVVGPDGAIRGTTPIDLPRAVMMHDFAVTERHAVFMDLPATFDFARMLGGGPFLQFEPDRPSRFGILPRDGEGSEIRWFESPSCYVFHTLNAFEEGDEVVLVGCRYERFPGTLGMGGPPTEEHPAAPGDFNATAEGPAAGDEAPRLHRWRFDLATGETRSETIEDVPCEFPRINDVLAGRRSRFGYATDGELSGFLKVDLRGGPTLRHRHGPGRLGGEGVFVPRPDASAEDDGWLLTYVFDQASGTSELVVVDALAFDDRPVARILIPARVPHGFHGTWLPGEVLG